MKRQLHDCLINHYPLSEVLLQGRSEGTLMDLSMESPRPGTGGDHRPVLCAVALLCLPSDAGCSDLGCFCVRTCFLELLVLLLLFLSVPPAARVLS